MAGGAKLINFYEKLRESDLFRGIRVRQVRLFVGLFFAADVELGFFYINFGLKFPQSINN